MAKAKQKAADAAYHRAEAQRALVMILDCAERTHEAGIADAAATVRAHFLTVSEPAKVKTLAGQIDLVDGSVEGDDGLEHQPPPGSAGVPMYCPRCATNMMIVYGGNWTPVYRVEGTPAKLQCASCSQVVTVSDEVYAIVRELRRSTIGASDAAPVKKERGPKVRGAG